MVTACSRTVESMTVNSASSAARPPVIEAVRDSPASSARATASAMPRTARSEFFNLTCPGSGATNILFTAVNRPLVLPFVLSAASRGGGGSRT